MPKPIRLIHERLWAGEGDAIEDASGVLTYAEVRARVAGAASTLRAAGIGPGSAVAVALPRSADAIVSLFAVWASSAVVICVDPTWPIERIREIASLTHASAVLTDEELATELAARGLASWPVRGQRLAQERVQTIASPGPFASSPDAAYVIFTSGTTKKPKGVVNSHQSFGNYLDWRNRSLAIEPGLRVAAMAPMGVDAMLRELVWPLTAGGCVVPITDEDRGDAARLVATLRRYRVAVAHTLPSVLDVLLDEPGFGNLPDLQLVHPSAERLPWSTVRRFQRTSGAALHHSYGPTETAVSVTFFDCTSSGNSANNFVPLGRPIDNVTIHVMQHGVPVGPGVVGELYIGGESVGLGYFDDVRATADAFIETSDGERWFRSGDLGAVNPDGTIQFHGRVDDQLKVNGYRVEPGEIESALISHPGVREAVVFAGHDDDLVAVIQLEPGPPIETSELRESLARGLPRYLMPRIEIVDTVPRTSTGKVDRRAVRDGLLRHRDSSSQPMTADFSERIREIVLQTWREVIPYDVIQEDDDFFDIGGVSIHAMRITTRLRKFFGRTVDVRLIFDHPTVRELAGVIGEHMPAPPSSARAFDSPGDQSDT